MNKDERRNSLLDKANNLIDTISECMRTVEDVEAAKKKIVIPESELSLELPTNDQQFKDVFKLQEIFDEKGIEKIKAYILNELEFLEESALQILDNAGFNSRSLLPSEDEDKDMKIVIPEKVESKAKRSVKKEKKG